MFSNGAAGETHGDVRRAAQSPGGKKKKKKKKKRGGKLKTSFRLS